MANYELAGKASYGEYTITDYKHINVFQLTDHKDYDVFHTEEDDTNCMTCRDYTEYWQTPCKSIPFDKYGLPVEEMVYWPTSRT